MIQISPFYNRMSQEGPPPIRCPRCLANYGVLRFVDPTAKLSRKSVECMVKHSSTTGGNYVVVHLHFQEDMVAFLAAYLMVVIMAMLITNVLLALVMIVVGEFLYQLCFCSSFFFSLWERIFVSSVLIKVPHGGWLPFAVSIVLVVIMFSWNHER